MTHTTHDENHKQHFQLPVRLHATSSSSSTPLSSPCPPFTLIHVLSPKPLRALPRSHHSPYVAVRNCRILHADVAPSSGGTPVRMPSLQFDQPCAAVPTNVMRWIWGKMEAGDAWADLSFGTRRTSQGHTAVIKNPALGAFISLKEKDRRAVYDPVKASAGLLELH